MPEFDQSTNQKYKYLHLYYVNLLTCAHCTFQIRPSSTIHLLAGFFSFIFFNITSWCQHNGFAAQLKLFLAHQVYTFRVPDITKLDILLPAEGSRNHSLSDPELNAFHSIPTVRQRVWVYTFIIYSEMGITYLPRPQNKIKRLESQNFC